MVLVDAHVLNIGTGVGQDRIPSDGGVDRSLQGRMARGMPVAGSPGIDVTRTRRGHNGVGPEQQQYAAQDKQRGE